MRHIQIKVTDALYNLTANVAMKKGLKLQALVGKALIHYLSVIDIQDVSSDVALNVLTDEGNKK